MKYLHLCFFQDTRFAYCKGSSVYYGKNLNILSWDLNQKNAYLETLLAAICQTERQSYSLIPWELPTFFLRPPSSLVLTFQLMAGREMKTYPFQSPLNKVLRSFYEQEFEICSAFGQLGSLKLMNFLYVILINYWLSSRYLV